MDTIFTDGQLTKAIETMRQKGMTPDRFNRLLSSGIFADVCDSNACLDDRAAIRIALKLEAAVSDRLIISVDYSQNLETMIAAGRYDWKNDDTTAERFPIKGEGVVQYEALLLHWDAGTSSEKAIEATADLDTTNPWQPGKIEHVLSFGATYPEEQRKYPIIGLGSVAEVGRYRCVPGLNESDRGRSLGLGWFGFGWRGSCRFLVVRKLSSAPVA